jgi:hypothetical protein
MTPIYIVELITKARRPTIKNLMNMLALRFPSPYITKIDALRFLHIYVKEDDDDVEQRLETFLEYANQHTTLQIKVTKP